MWWISLSIIFSILDKHKNVKIAYFVYYGKNFRFRIIIQVTFWRLYTHTKNAFQRERQHDSSGHKFIAEHVWAKISFPGLIRALMNYINTVKWRNGTVIYQQQRS